MAITKGQKSTNDTWYKRQLYRSSKDKMFTGLIGGIGEYSDINPTLLRLAYAALTAFTGFFPGIAAYIVGSIIVPEEKK